MQRTIDDFYFHGGAKLGLKKGSSRIFTGRKNSCLTNLFLQFTDSNKNSMKFEAQKDNEMKQTLSFFLIALFSCTSLFAQTSTAPANTPDDFSALMKEYEGGYNQLMKQVTKLTSEAKQKKVSSADLTNSISSFNAMAVDYRKRLDNSTSV